jgi:D-aminopeptidase
VFAGHHRLNGNGEMTGLSWIAECGTLTTPIGLTNTSSVGMVRDTLVAIEAEKRPASNVFWALPVVAETWDGLLSDCHGFHVHGDHVRAAFDAAADGPVAEGNVGSGTGMVCHGFKGGIGTSSRRTPGAHSYTVGVLVQANHGLRSRLTVNGAPVGAVIGADAVPTPDSPVMPRGAHAGGSIIVVVATDAPLLPHQCQRLAQRASLGIARTGGAGEHSSGDLILAFATGNTLVPSDYGASPPDVQQITMLTDAFIDPLFHATVEATEEAIVNAMVAAHTMTGRDGITAYALPHTVLIDVLDRHHLRHAGSSGQSLGGGPTLR